MPVAPSPSSARPTGVPALYTATESPSDEAWLAARHCKAEQRGANGAQRLREACAPGSEARVMQREARIRAPTGGACSRVEAA